MEETMLHIVLHEPEMPANTGNIGRTCVACGAVLHLIEPLGFRLNEKMIKRAGLDYWDKLDVRTYINFEDFLEKNNNPKIYMATTKAKHVYSAPAYEDDEDVYIMFGKESAGIPEEILLDYEETSIRIPMLPHIRSLNLSNSVAIVAYEVLRHQGFEAFQMEGQLHHYHW
jgi:tRNA (cytidine/uridine-2'-O-)-methyltransferase